MERKRSSAWIGIRQSPQKENKRTKGWDGTTIKLIAAAAMLCSHIEKCLLFNKKEFLFLDAIGRIAFPIFCFFIVEGFCHTHDRKKYLIRLWMAAVFSEVCFDLAFFGRFYAPWQQNVMFTMCIGICTLWGMEKSRGAAKILPAAAGMALAWFLKVDYGFYGIWLILCFYLLRGMKWEWTYIQAGSQFASIFLYGGIQFFSLGSIPILWLYNGERGKGLKYAFYLFYPLHLLALVLIRSMI